MAKKPIRRKVESAITDRDISRFTKKLDRWGGSLPVNEKALLDLLVNRARLLEPGAVIQSTLQRDLLAATRKVFANLGSVFAPQGWARIDPIWYKSGGIDFSEIEFKTKAILKNR